MGEDTIEIKVNLKELLHESMDPAYFSNAISYSSTKIKSVELEQDNKILKVSFCGQESEFNELVNLIVTKIGRSVMNKENKTLFQNMSLLEYPGENIWEKLKAEGMVYDYGSGHLSYNGLFLDLINEMEGVFKKLAQKLNAKEVHLPNFIPWDRIKLLGLVDEFPQYLFFISPLVNDLHTIESFQKEETIDCCHIKSYMDDPQYCLKTSACSLLYPTLENMDFNEYGYFTVLGHCTRRETMNVVAFERLTEFQMREIIFVGDPEGVNQFYAFSTEFLTDLIKYFDLTADISMANDSFFVANYNKFKLMQLLGCNKYEANVLVPHTGSKIAFASFNNHQNFFGRRFNFTYQGKTAVSACIGFGLERLVYGILSQRNLDRDKIYNMLGFLKEKYELN
ncbi:MAG: hypothetical protein N2645_08295 [Clostridia bacterium]|nr:hypothetical protein [Clostridia bacterium]